MEIRPFLVMEVLERAQELEGRGRPVVHLEVGEPDFETPEPVKEAARRALADGHTHYTHSLGIRELREAIAERYASVYHLEVDPGRVLVTQGTSSGLFLVFRALLEPGDAVLLPDPSFACYWNLVPAAGGEAVPVPVLEEEGFRLTPAAVRDAASRSRRSGLRPRALLLNSPANPTGAVLSGAELAELAEAARSEDLYLISDEIYHGLVYEQPERERSAAEFSDRCFIVDGFSKRYAMTGWRLGWCIPPAEFLRPLQNLQQNLFICAASFAQHGGIAALRHGGPAAEEMRREYGRRRQVLLDGLERLGLAPAVSPRGAFYAFVNARHLDPDSVRLANRLLDDAGVAVAPGVDFGPGGEGYLRLSYATSVSRIEAGLERLERFLSHAASGKADP